MCIVVASMLLFFMLVTPVHATVGLEYLGPYPLRPQPVNGDPHTLSGSATVGNSGTDPAVFTLALVSSEQFNSTFSWYFSDNNFALNPGQRKDFTITLTSQSYSQTQDYGATIAILAKATGGSGGASGVASFNVPVVISQATSTITTTTSESSSVTSSELSTTSELTTSSTTAEVTTSSTTNELTTSSTAETPPPPPKRCVIATAAYGSDVAPEVQHMRYVRDKLIGSTHIGRILVEDFNAFYYLWSPSVARVIAENDFLRVVFRVLLLPLVWIVHLVGLTFTSMTMMTGNAELASVMSFFIAALASVAAYVGLPVFVVMKMERGLRIRRRSRGTQ